MVSGYFYHSTHMRKGVIIYLFLSPTVLRHMVQYRSCHLYHICKNLPPFRCLLHRLHVSGVRQLEAFNEKRKKLVSAMKYRETINKIFFFENRKLLRKSIQIDLSSKMSHKACV